MLNLKTGKSFKDACDGIHAVDTPKSITRRSALNGLAAILAAGVAPSLCGSITRGMGYRNLGGRLAAMGGGAKPYEELEYISSNGNQYIDTGIYTAITGAYWIRCKFSVYGNDNKLTGGDGGFLLGVVSGKVFSSNIPVVDGQMYDVICTNNGTGRVFYIDGVRGNTASNFRNHFKIGIFCYYDSLGGVIADSFMIQSNSIFINTLLRDYIAVLKDGIPCMYDRISGEYFYNNGTGSFGYKKKDGTIVEPT